MSHKLIRISGQDARSFLQSLVTNDVDKLDAGPIYAALLTPQGKYLADFFLVAEGDDVLMDVDETLAQGLVQRLSMYKLRADVDLEAESRYLHRGLGDTPQDGWTDPRHPELGWRAWRDAPPETETTDWDALRVKYLVPQSGVELTPDSYILECNFEALNGVDFRKGCYVGQEVTARMKHKTTLRKGLARVHVEGTPEAGSDIEKDGKVVGRLLTRTGNEGIAYLRFDRAIGPLDCAGGEVELTTSAP